MGDTFAYRYRYLETSVIHARLLDAVAVTPSGVFELKKILAALLVFGGLTAGLGLVTSQAAENKISVVTDDSFKTDVLASTTPVVVDFYADWCGPCRRMGPVFDQLSETYGGKVKFVRLNIDQSPKTAARYGIRSIPSFAVFRGGRLVDGVVGAVPSQQLASVINRGSGVH